jgi:hypothetical protein
LAATSFKAAVALNLSDALPIAGELLTAALAAAVRTAYDMKDSEDTLTFSQVAGFISTDCGEPP